MEIFKLQFLAALILACKFKEISTLSKTHLLSDCRATQRLTPGAAPALCSATTRERGQGGVKQPPASCSTGVRPPLSAARSPARQQKPAHRQRGWSQPYSYGASRALQHYAEYLAEKQPLIVHSFLSFYKKKMFTSIPRHNCLNGPSTEPY